MARRRRLAAELKRLRVEREMSLAQVEEALGWSGGTLSRIENNKRDKVSLTTVRQLLDLYELKEPEQRNSLVGLARQASGHEWSQEYGKDIVSPALRHLIGLESEASLIRAYEPELIPGLVQTAEYARAVISVRNRQKPVDFVDQRVEVRLERQRILGRVDPPAPMIHIILSEGALRRRVGGSDVMQEQAKHLLGISNKPGSKVSIQIIPFVSGAHPTMVGSFALMDFPDPRDPSIVYEESLTGSVTKEKADTLRVYDEVFREISGLALPLSETRKMIKDYSVL